LGLEVPDGEVLLSDFELWHFVLNQHHLPYDQDDADAWDARHPGPSREYDAATRSELQASWDRLLTIEQGAFDHAWVGQVGRNVQATFEVLRWSNVGTVTLFTSRPPRCR
jgi:hypothetical protein